MPNRRHDVQQREAECPGQPVKKADLHQGEVFPQLPQVKHLAFVCSPGGRLVDTPAIVVSRSSVPAVLAAREVAHTGRVGPLSEQDLGPAS